VREVFGAALFVVATACGKTPGWDPPKPPPTGQELNSQCDDGDADSCRILANRVENGTLGENRDVDRALQLYSRSCELGSRKGCAGLGRIGERYDRGDGVTQDRARAAEIYELACSHGDNGACLDLSKACYYGYGVPKDFEKAAALSRRVCDSGEKWLEGSSCRNIGIMLLEGSGVTRNVLEAARYLLRACNAGDEIGCKNLEDAMAQDEDARAFVAKARAEEQQRQEEEDEEDRAETQRQREEQAERDRSREQEDAEDQQQFSRALRDAQQHDPVQKTLDDAQREIDAIKAGQKGSRNEGGSQGGAGGNSGGSNSGVPNCPPGQVWFNCQSRCVPADPNRHADCVR